MEIGVFTALIVAVVLFASIVTVSAVDPPYEGLAEKAEAYSLPRLQYSFDALKPWIDRATVQAHYEGHHETYRKKMNALLDQWRDQETLNNFATEPILFILNRLEEVPDTFRTKLKNAMGGFINHCFYWAVMSPNPSKMARQPGGELLHEIEATFGGFASFKTAFTTTALELFGSGYVWMVRDPSERPGRQLLITTTTNQDCPYSNGEEPLLVIDLWEHAYYLKHQFRRAQYIEDWWMVVDWSAVNALNNFWVELKKPKTLLHQEF